MTWRHHICLDCWNKKNPNTSPGPLYYERHGEPNRCCFCGAQNFDPIYIRENPVSAELVCGGSHIEEAQR